MCAMANVGATDESEAAGRALARLVPVLCEDAIYALAAGGDAAIALEGCSKRRAEVYGAVVQGHAVPRMSEQLDLWQVHMARAMAPVAPPVWLPMMDVVREKVTLEIGARGLRSLFSSKPSDKDIARVKRFGTIATRVLRAVFVADGPLDREETTAVNALVASLGLPDTETQALYAEPPMAVDAIEFTGEPDRDVWRALIRGAWLAAAWDSIDPREENVLRVVAQRLGVTNEELEAARTEAQMRVDARRQVGLAAIDGIRFLLSDRVPGMGVQIAAQTATLVVPRRYREEALAQIGHGAPVTLAKRYGSLASDERASVLGIAWAAALAENPTASRRAHLYARFERFAADIGDDGGRAVVDAFVSDAMVVIARGMK
jgi:tellurite resistance protein